MELFVADLFLKNGLVKRNPLAMAWPTGLL